MSIPQHSHLSFSMTFRQMIVIRLDFRVGKGERSRCQQLIIETSKSYICSTRSPNHVYRDVFSLKVCVTVGAPDLTIRSRKSTVEKWRPDIVNVWTGTTFLRSTKWAWKIYAYVRWTCTCHSCHNNLNLQNSHGSRRTSTYNGMFYQLASLLDLIAIEISWRIIKQRLSMLAHTCFLEYLASRKFKATPF